MTMTMASSRPAIPHGNVVEDAIQNRHEKVTEAHVGYKCIGYGAHPTVS